MKIYNRDYSGTINSVLSGCHHSDKSLYATIYRLNKNKIRKLLGQDIKQNNGIEILMLKTVRRDLKFSLLTNGVHRPYKTLAVIENHNRIKEILKNI
jgi:hypothetical protein